MKGEGCKMEILGKLAEITNGNVERVKNHSVYPNYPIQFRLIQRTWPKILALF